MKDLKEHVVLVVDDVVANVDLLVSTLSEEYTVRVALDGESALKDIAALSPDLILLDVMMPGMNGFDVCKILKSDKETSKIPIIFLTALDKDANEAKGLKLGAVDYITKPFNIDLVRARVRNHMELKRYQDHLEELVEERTRELAITQDVTIWSLALLAETRDRETGEHIRRTSDYVRILAEKIREKNNNNLLTQKNIQLITKSAPLHDIGKVGIPDSILRKPGKLTDDEFETMKLHTVYGGEAIEVAEQGLGSNSFLHFAKEIALTHHEKWDGSGYPRGLKDEKIPISGRLMALADVYDALVHKRVYKPPFSHDKAREIIIEGRGSHFDPDVVDAFLELEDRFIEIAKAYPD